MLDFFADKPGRWFVVVTFLPLAAALILLLAGTYRRLTNPTAKPSRLPGYFACAVMILATGMTLYSGGSVIHGWTSFRDELLPDGLSSRLIYDEPDLLKLQNIETESVNWLVLNPSATSQRNGDTRTTNRTPFVTDSPSITLNYFITHLTLLMFALVTIITTCVMVFSLGYMNDEAKNEVEDHEAHNTRRGRFGQFYLFLLIFAFSMLFLLLSNNLVQIFIGWELVGICSYFLIGFYHERDNARKASLKAVIMNRIGDAGILIGLLMCWQHHGTFRIDNIISLNWSLYTDAEAASQFSLTIMGLAFLVGCIAKSAQWPLHTWLPDAMEGPTPVSALIHAATMVAAGVYLLGKILMLLTPMALVITQAIGGVTMFLGAILAMRQTDIKRVLAYSTMSQLGLMFFVIGAGFYAAGMFHLITHAFFKALLFLGAGSVIHAMHHEQDVRHMGGLRKRMPLTAYYMLVGVLAISGFPLLSGWASKEIILGNAIMSVYLNSDTISSYFIAVPLFLISIMTGYYMLRMWLLTFLGTSRSEEAQTAHETPVSMLVPLTILVVFTIFVGASWPIWDPHESYVYRYLNINPGKYTAALTLKEFHPHEYLEKLLTYVASGLVLITGFAIAYIRYSRGVMLRELQAEPSPYSAFYFDELYHLLFVRPVAWLAAVAARRDKGDGVTVDAVVSGPTLAIPVVGERLRRVQSGNVRQYVLALALTLAVVLGILLFR
ncbi:MAG: NADH-quinone oxidoreductase subunit L [Fimbriiglobus sp.]